jgi:probable HAF family extracellular repeat protein
MGEYFSLEAALHPRSCISNINRERRVEDDMQRLIKVLLFFSVFGLPILAADFKFVQFDVPGALLTRPFGVNARGQIVGLYRDANGNHGFLRDIDGTYVAIDVPGAVFTNATGVNARGDIVGRWTDSNGNNHAYQRTVDGQFTLFDPASPCVVSKSQTVPHGINDEGEIVGRCFDASGKELGFLRYLDGSFSVFAVPGSSTTDAWMLTNAGEIVGDYSDSVGVHGYVLALDGQFTSFDFPGAGITSGRWINERGDITGVYRIPLDDNPQTKIGDQGFLLRGQDFVTIGYPAHGVAIGDLTINDHGLLVGGFIDEAGKEHGFAAIQIR